MIRTNIVKLTTIPAIAYRQKLPSGGSGVTILKYGIEQPGNAAISKSSGEAIPSQNTNIEIYPLEAFNEAISLTVGMPYKKQKNVRVTEEMVQEIEDEKDEVINEEIEEVEVIIDSEEYDRIVALYTDKNGKLSYDLLNRDFIQTAHSSGQVRLMLENKETADDIRFQIVKTRIRNITRNPTLTDEQIYIMIELLDEVSPKGVFNSLNSEIRKWLAESKI